MKMMAEVGEHHGSNTTFLNPTPVQNLWVVDWRHSIQPQTQTYQISLQGKALKSAL